MDVDPKQGPVDQLLRDVWDSVQGLTGGAVADYIPELAKADPDTVALSLATLDGAVYTVGDLVPFTIQSVSKPFVYALALADRGPDEILSRVGAEPTGDPFNSISLDQGSGRAYNPMVNAGAIVTANLVGGADRDEQFQRILAGLSAFAGRPLEVDASVFASERTTGDRNRAIAYLMRSAGLLDADVDAAVEMYFRQCSILVTAQDLAIMAATLANAGVNPVTGAAVVPREVVAPVLTVMSTCGMYDYAGEWLYRVGLPAKSGVSGAVVSALPGQLGLAAHSPKLDERGNSVRGVAACERVSAELGLHLLLPSERGNARVLRIYRGHTIRSKRIRMRAERDILDAQGGQVAVHELLGDLEFAGSEALVRQVLEDPERTRWRIFDLSRTTRLDRAAIALLGGLIAQLREAEVAVALVEPKRPAARASAAALAGSARTFGDIDAALEWSEAELLAQHGADAALADHLVPMAEQDVLAGLPPEVVAVIEQRCTSRVFTAGTVLFDEGDPSDGLYFIGAGLVGADVRVPGQGKRRRLSTAGAGSSFGELALIDQRPRSTRIVALEPTMCHVLSPEAFVAMRKDDPDACAELTLALARNLSQRLRDSTAEVAALEAR